MSCVNRLPTVFVAATNRGLLSTLQKLLPQTTLIELPLNDVGKLSSTDQTRVVDEAEVLLAGADVLYDVIFQAQRLKWSQCTWLPAPGATITRTGGVYAQAMAEYVLTYILTKERYVIQAFKDQERAHWESVKFREYRNLCDISVCILGLGDIGKEVARMCKATGMYVYGITRSVPTEDKRCDTVDCYKSLSELADILPACDYICSVLPSTPATIDLLSGEMLSKCQPKMYRYLKVYATRETV